MIPGKNNILDNQQNGFRRYRSTTNTLHDIQVEIQSTLKAKHMMGLIAFEIFKAYDTTWRPHILETLSNIICNGNLSNFIKNFLTDRIFQVKVRQRQTAKNICSKQRRTLRIHTIDLLISCSD